jgi:hypothetical protein
LFLGVASHVGRNHSQRHAESEILGVAKPESDETSPLRVVSIGFYLPFLNQALPHLITSRQPN